VLNDDERRRALAQDSEHAFVFFFQAIRRIDKYDVPGLPVQFGQDRRRAALPDLGA
jgi:hypothetical protein